MHSNECHNEKVADSALPSMMVLMNMAGVVA